MPECARAETRLGEINVLQQRWIILQQDRVIWPWRRSHVAATPRHATLGDFHLCHRRGAVFTAKPWRAAGEQLLGAKCRDNCELKGVQMRRPGNHAASRFIDWRGRDAACRSPLLPPLLPVSNLIPHGAAVVTSPVGLRRDDWCQRPELLRTAFRTRRGLQGTLVLLRCRRFPKAFEIHDRESRVRMITVIVGSGRCIQTNSMSTTIHRAIRNNGET